MDNKKSEEVTKFELFLIFVELQNQEYNEVTGNEGMLDDRKMVGKYIMLFFVKPKHICRETACFMF